MPSQHLPVRRIERPNIWEDPDWQKIWLSTQRREWHSLAVVPAGEGLPTIEVAQVLMEVGWQHRGLPMSIADLRRVPLGHVDSVTAEIRSHVDRGERVLIALGSIIDNPSAVLLAQIADCALLCVGLGATAIADAEQTVMEIGRDHFLGSILLRSFRTT